MSEERSDAVATGSDDYSAVYYHDYSGPPYTYDEPHWKAFFGRIADQVIALFDPASTYDAGCAKGFMVRAFAERGVDARGGDISTFAIAEAPPELAEQLEVRDLTEPFDRRYDVITCVEVLEHMSADDARTALANICDATDVLILSTTPDDYTEPTHVNIRQPAGWAQDLGAYEFFRRTDVDASFLSPWAVVYQKQSALRPLQLVTRYETLLQPLLREVHAKRQALLELRRQLDTASAPVMVERDALMVERDALIVERAALIAERDEVVDLRNITAAELEEYRGSDAMLSRLAVVDELMGARAELAEVKVHTENAIAESGREAARLREMLAATTGEVAAAKLEAVAALQQAAEHSAQADERVQQAAQEREHDLVAVRSSMSWRIGQAVLLPVRLARRARRR